MPVLRLRGVARLKRVVSVSLGSSRRDHEFQFEAMGQHVAVGREGTDGDLTRAAERIAELDGAVDAIGLGGIDAYLWVGPERYEIGDGVRLLQIAQKTPVVDGSGIKNTLERDAVTELIAAGQWLTPASRVLLVSALDRFGMAEAFTAAGCPCVFGDMIFALGIDYPVSTLGELGQLAQKYRTRMQKLPFHMFYPVGRSQDEALPPERRTLYARYYDDADVIAGDFHFIRKYLPDRLNGKVILTNTTTAADGELLAARGAAALITTTPAMGGRSFGTNVIEALLVALLGRPPEAITPDDLRALSRELALRPGVQAFTSRRDDDHGQS